MFREFEKSFSHFFEECERGFINEVIVNLFVRTERPGKTLISYLQTVSDLCFIRQGVVEVFNNNNDAIH
jgi:signal-transduction protein with cAMP-binding, CBS, and nucleotidyltransferase domain